MDNPRPEKVAVVEEVRQRLDDSSGAILTEYRGLSVKDLATLRRSLSDVGAEFRIYKNTLVRIAARDAGLDQLEPMLEGPTAIAFVSGDAVPVARTLRDFARTNPLLVLKGGLLGTKVITEKDTAALADLPPREVLLARLAGGLAAPMVQFAGLLQALPRNFAYGLKALIDQGGGVPASPEATESAVDESESAPVAETVEDPSVTPDPVVAEPEAEPAIPDTNPEDAVPAVAAETAADDTTPSGSDDTNPSGSDNPEGA